MSQIKIVMADFCDLAVSNTEGELQREIEFELTMDLLMDAAPAEMETFRTFIKATRIVERIKAATGERRLRWATKLWNTIDCMDRPEALFALMLRELPDCFYEQSPNGLKFTY